MTRRDLQKPTTPAQEILGVIHHLRGERVMLDEDLARLYGVETRSLNQAVRRHPARFPGDFMFQLSDVEWENLRSQTVISSSRHGGRRHTPLAFTEQGVAMLSSVLNSERAIAVNVEIMRAFVRFRRYLATQEELGTRLAELESQVEEKLGRQDQKLRLLFEAMRQLRDQVRTAPPPATPKRRIGFQVDEDPLEYGLTRRTRPRRRPRALK